jgi:hypothetical protein
MSKLFENIFLETKLDEVANIYDGLLMLLEQTTQKISMKETNHKLFKKGLRFKEATISLGKQINTIEFYNDRLIKLNEEIAKLNQVDLRSITGIDENRNRAIKAFRTLGNFAQKTNDNNEHTDLIHYIEQIRTTINLALSILRHNRIFQNDSAFQDIAENDIIPETRDTKILYNKDRFNPN